MELPQTIEWGLHCCWLLAQTDGRAPVPRRRLAEFFDLPEQYLAKMLKKLVAAGILTSAPGINGGYRLSRPAEQITVLEVVRALRSETSLFHCAEIRQRGPVGLSPEQCRTPCGIARVMHQAEFAWREQLAATTISDVIDSALPPSQERARVWLGARARPELLAPAKPTP
jgi:Rrf2 family protein